MAFVLPLLFLPMISPPQDPVHARDVKVGRCRLTAAKPVLKAPMVSALEATI
jgi:hypothetical protein